MASYTTTVLCVLLALASGSLVQAQNCTTIAQTAAGVPQLSILWAAVQKSSLLAATQDPTTAVTLFAPTNDAILAFITAKNLTAEALLNDTATLNSVLSYHVVPVVATAAQLTNGQVLPTLNGQTLTVNKTDAGVKIIAAASVANVLTADTPACKSYIHIIDAVLVPATGSAGAAGSSKGAVATKKVYYKPTYSKKGYYYPKKVYVKVAPKPSPKPSPKTKYVYYKKPVYKKSFKSFFHKG